MHDGSMNTLEEVMDYYSEGIISNPFLDVEMVRSTLSLQETIAFYERKSETGNAQSIPVKLLLLSKREKADLVAFMKSLDGEGWQQVREPDSFPE